LRHALDTTTNWSTDDGNHSLCDPPHHSLRSRTHPNESAGQGRACSTDVLHRHRRLSLVPPCNARTLRCTQARDCRGGTCDNADVLEGDVPGHAAIIASAKAIHPAPPAGRSQRGPPARPPDIHAPNMPEVAYLLNSSSAARACALLPPPPRLPRRYPPVQPSIRRSDCSSTGAANRRAGDEAPVFPNNKRTFERASITPEASRSPDRLSLPPGRACPRAGAPIEEPPRGLCGLHPPVVADTV
jgi:hypothetical protein